VLQAHQNHAMQLQNQQQHINHLKTVSFVLQKQKKVGWGLTSVSHGQYIANPS
jgi:hypothetical protein